MDIMKDVYQTMQFSRDKEKIIAAIREMIPGTIEARNILYNLERNAIFDSRLRLEVACKVPDWYYSFEIIDDIIKCAANTELMKRLYEANINEYGSFVAVQITDPQEIENMYKSGIYEIQCATVSNFHASPEFLKKVIEETDNERIKEFASEVLDVLIVKQTEDNNVIEEMYEKGTYDIQLAAVSNVHAKSDFLEKIVADDEVPKAIRYRALETFGKISST